MRPFFLGLLAVAAFLSMTPLPVHAGWGPQGCSPVGGFAPQFAPVAMQAFAQPASAFSGWDDGPDGWRFQYQAGRVIAGYNPDTGEYRVRFGGEWSVATRAPWEASDEAERRQKRCKCSDTCTCGRRCQCKANSKACSKECTCAPQQAEKVGQVFFGVDASKLDGKERYRVNGRQCSREEVIQAIAGDNQLTDDSGKLRLTVIGQDADRQAVLKDLAANPALSQFRDKVLVQDYAPTDWAVARSGFKTDGHPVIYLQDSTGRVLHRQDVYIGADKLADTLRKADPNYSPANDPNLNQPKPAPAPSPAGGSFWDEIPTDIKWIGGIIMGFLTLVFVRNGKK